MTAAAVRPIAGPQGDAIGNPVQEGSWIQGDYLDVVLHVLTPDARRHSKHEELWGDVPAVELEAAATA